VVSRWNLLDDVRENAKDGEQLQARLDRQKVQNGYILGLVFTGHTSSSSSSTKQMQA